MFQTLLLVALSILLGPSAAQQTKSFTVEEKPQEVLEKKVGVGERYALLVGISKYQNPNINLNFAAADAEALQRLLLDPEIAGYKPENVKLLVNEQATRKNVMSALNTWLGPLVQKSDSVLIFYSGHGALGAADAAYWVTYDADVADLFSSALSNKEISKLIAELPASRKITLIDSCYSEATAKGSKALVPADVMNEFKGTGVVTITASTGQEKSVEIGGHGAFTYHLLDAMQGKGDANSNGVVEMEEVWNYLKEKVSKTAAETGNRQTPVLIAERMEHGFPVTINPARAAGATLAQLKQMYTAGTITVDEIGEAEKLFTQRDVDTELRSLYRSLAAGELTPVYFRRLRQAHIPVGPAIAAASTPAAGITASAEETESFRTADGLNTIDGWNRYFQQFPNGVMQADARAKLSKLEADELQKKAEMSAFESARARDTESGWEEYLTRFPAGPNVSEARRRIADIRAAAERAKQEPLAFIIADQQNTEEGWANFIRQYPSSQMAILAQSKLDALRKANLEKENALYSQATTANSPDSWDAYIKAYPGGRFIAEAMKMKGEAVKRVEEENAYTAAKTADTIASWNGYVTKYPAGTKLDEARRRIDQLTWIQFADVTPIVAGSFMMGNAKGEGDEKPPRRVEIDALRMGRTEVTNAQYLKFLDEAKRPRPKDPDFAKNYMAANPDLPVVNITYADALEFCKWLSAKTGATVRLPTEAEWEYAALGGHDGWMYPWGSTDPKTMARYNGNDNTPMKTVAREAFPANSFGLFNMAGNVAEWVLDYYDSDYYKAGSQKNPTGPASGKERVVRGGSFKTGESEIRVSRRSVLEPIKADQSVGFRIVVK